MTFELVIRKTSTKKRDPKELTTVDNMGDLIPLFKPISGSVVEHGIIICLDADNHVLHTGVISTGTKTSGMFDIQQVLKMVIMHDAHHFIFAHNHPTGNLKPSKADKRTFKRVKKAGHTIGCELSDSVIVCGNRLYGMKYKYEYDGDKR